MIVELVAVGTELLLGEIANTNAALIARRMAACGLDAHHQVVVGDNPERIVEVLDTACGRADVVVVSGGVGPTPDDVTREAVAALVHGEMARDAGQVEAIRAHVLARRGVVREPVFRMAEHPVGSSVLANRAGLALGFVLSWRSTWIFVLPGVPDEMEVMLDEQVVPRLKELTRGETVRSRVVPTTGLGESEIMHRLGELCALANPSVAFRITEEGVDIRITAKADSQDEADRLTGDVAEAVRELLGDAV